MRVAYPLVDSLPVGKSENGGWDVPVPGDSTRRNLPKSLDKFTIVVGDCGSYLSRMLLVVAAMNNLGMNKY